MSDEYTPTTDDVFEATLYTWVDWKAVYPAEDAARDGFDRWLAQVKAEAQVKALRELADELDHRRASHDVAECAGFVEGETGRQSAIDSWLEVCDHPDEFVAEYVDRIAREAGIATEGNKTGENSE